MSNTSAIVLNLECEENYQRVLRFARRLCRNQADAEDLTQETFFRAHRCAGDTIDPRTYRGWLCRITMNLFLDLKRSQSRRVQTVSFVLDESEKDVEGLLADPTLSPEDQLLEKHLSPELVRALETLKPMDREMLIGLTVEDRSYQDIAEAFGLTPEKVRSRIWRAVRKLRDHLAKDKEVLVEAPLRGLEGSFA